MIGGLSIEPTPDGTIRLENGQTSADPIQTFHGAFMYHRTDVAIPGRGPVIGFARSYNSADTRSGPMGPGWTHTYNARIRDPGDGTGDLYLVRPDGNTDRFRRNNDETFSASAAVYSSLVRNADESYTVTEIDQSRSDFDGAGRLTKVTDRYGNASTLTYNTNGQLSTIADPAGRGSLTLAYTSGLLTSLTDWASPVRTVTYQYDGSGRLWKVTDREGQTTTFTYDGTSARIATITDARTHIALTLTYDVQGRVATQNDARGLTSGDVTTFGYVVNGDGTRVTTTTEPVTSFEPSFHPAVVDTYDANGWLTTRVSTPSSTETLTETYAYDPTGNRTAVTDPRGNRTDFCYDTDYAGAPIAGSRGNLTRLIAPAPTTGANRSVTLVGYDSKNNVVQTVSPRGVPSGASVTCSTDLSAVTTAYATDLAYDAQGVKLLSVTSRFTDPDTGLKTATAKYEYNDAANPGLVTRVIPARGNTGGSPDYTYATSLTYFTTGSKAGLLSSVADALGDTTTFDYDAVGRLTSSVDANGNAAGGVPADHTTYYTYDKEDRIRFAKLPAPTVGGSLLVTETRYDEVGNPVVRVDANGQVTTYAYDVRDGLFQVKESPTVWTDPVSPPAGVITTEYAYDAAANLTRMTRAKGDSTNERPTDYVFDGRGLARRETQYPAWPTTTPTLVTTSSFDANGNALTLLDPLGKTTTNGYDALNRLTSIHYSDGVTPDVAYAYDANGNRTSMTDGTGSTSYAYDEANRLTSTTSPGPKIAGYRYDLDGNRTKLIYPDATAVTYAFNKASQMASLQDWASRSVAYTYWPDGLAKTATNPDVTVATYTYDNARRVTDLFHQKGSTTITHHTYTLDPVGNVTGLGEYVAGITQGGGSWAASVKINDDPGTVNQLEPDVAIGPDGAAQAVWTDERNGLPDDIYAARRDPATGVWSANQQVNDTTTGSQGSPSVAVDQSNNARAIWLDGRNGRVDIYYAKRSATTGLWSANVRVNSVTTFTGQNDPAVAVSGSGEAIAVWTRLTNKTQIYSARLPAGSSTWSAEMQVSTNANATKGQPHLAIGADGTAYAVWVQPTSSNADIWFASLAPGGNSWSANTKISDDPGTADQLQPEIGVDGAGTILVAWDDWRVSPHQLRVRKRPAGSSTWSPSVVVAADGANYRSLSVRSDGAALLAWYDGFNATAPNVWTSDYDPTSGSWSIPQKLNDTGPSIAAKLPAAALGASSSVVVWQGGASVDIYARVRGTGGGGTDTFTYGYDRLYRLTGVTGPDGAPAYGYDPLGNRTSKVLAGTTTNYSYDRADRISAAGATSITLNANGNTIAKGADSFTYDQPNRLKTATVSGTTETYVYDGDGTRFSRQIGGGTPIRYVSDVNRGLPVTIDDGTRKYVYGLGLAYAVSGSTIEVQHADRLGSIRAVTDGTGTVIASYRTDEFGISTASTGAAGSPYRYTGEALDASGFTYLRARSYDPSIGRFLSRDQFAGLGGAPLSLNRYGYVQNNPATRSDPSGLKSGVLVQQCNPNFDRSIQPDCVKTLPGTEGAWGNVRADCLTLSGQVGISGGIHLCNTSGHVQIQIQVGASTGVGGVVGYTHLETDASSPSQLAGFGAGFGASAGAGWVAGGDRCYAYSGRLINCVTGTTGLGAKVSPELFTPAEAHAEVSFTIDFNDLLHTLFGFR